MASARFMPLPGLRAEFPSLQLRIMCCLLLPVGGMTGENHEVVRGEIIQRGAIDCFKKGLTTSEGALVYCETSAVAFTGDRLIIASDKPVPGHDLSAVFSVAYAGSGPIEGQLTYFTADPFTTAVKYEDMTITPDGKFVIATTGFDRIKNDSNEWDGYNTLLSWPVDDSGSVNVIAATSNNGVTSSLGLREKISQALLSPEFPDEVPYFKVESVAAIAGHQLLFGIREVGAHYDRFVYTFKIISVQYKVNNGVLSLAGDFRLIYNLDMDSLSGAQQSSALSSIEYDPFHDRLFLLTSYETEEKDEGLGGYLWTLPLSGLSNGQAPSLVQTETGNGLQFAHKAEGITVLSEQLVMVIHDDDRVLGREVIENPETQFSRAAHQAAYTLVSVGHTQQCNQ